MRSLPHLLAFLLIITVSADAKLWLPRIFGDHMVLQRDHSNPVWGKAEPGQSVTVQIAGQQHMAKADSTGKWKLSLDPMSAGGPHELVIDAGETRKFRDVLVGEVWFCSGQSNMQWSVAQSNNAEVEIASANFPELRVITVPRVGTQEPQEDFEGQWDKCTPETIADFSAVGYFFGRRLHHALGVPIGLIDNAWGASVAEAWVPREVLERYERYDAYIADFDKRCVEFPPVLARWEQRMQKWIDGGRKGKQPKQPRDPRSGQHRPANIFNGMVYPTIGYGLRGMIWYQGESNSSRAADYRHLFPLLITTLRERWGQGDFPFYWVQIADFQAESDTPQDHGWAFLRESQTMTLDAVPNGGQAVIIDAGEGRDIHPGDKQTVANRLVRHALARDYGFDIAYESPRYRDMEINGNKALLTFGSVSDGGLYTFDVKEPIGFAIAGADRQFVWADAKLVGKNQVEVWSDQVAEPVAVRYAWAVNPVCNLYDRNGLAVTPFRTDAWLPAQE
ncbi:MAG: sialate O-acetylesterase [Verrucomicrobiota bacterium]